MKTPEEIAKEILNFHGKPRTIEALVELIIIGHVDEYPQSSGNITHVDYNGLKKEILNLITQAITLERQRAKKLVEALERDVQIIGAFLDRVTPEAIGKPDLSLAHLGMMEALHCYKRARQALAEYEGE